MKQVKEKILFYTKFALSLALVATTMAVACPQPVEPPPAPPGESEKSKARILFEGSDVAGLYVGEDGVVLYNSEQYQMSRNDLRHIFRLQSDNQRRYLNVEFMSNTYHFVNQEAYCTVSYRTDSGEETNLIIKMKVIAQKEGLIWLWNEVQDIGIIIVE